MKGVQLWQHPYVDVFKYCNINEWRLSQKEGDVSEIVDKTIGKKVFKLQGSVSASNYIQMPKSRCEMKSLGLNGKYIYIFLRVSPGKLFSLHLDLIVTNTRTSIEEPLKISLSNLFKESKFQNNLLIACKSSGKWSVICVDVRNVLNEYFGEKVVHKELKIVTLCANMNVKGVYTSDILYSPKTLPKEIALKVPKIEEWSNSYDWVHIPELFGNENIEMNQGKGEEEEKKEIKNKKSYVKEVYKDLKAEKKENIKKPKEKSQENVNEGIKNAENLKEAEKNIEEKKSNEKEENRKGKKITEPENETKKFEKEVKSQAEKRPKRQVPQKSNQKSLKTDQVLEESLENCIEINADMLTPDPILEISNTFTISPGPYTVIFISSEIFSSYPSPFKDSTNKFIFFTSNRLIILMNPTNSEKIFFFGHTCDVQMIQLFKTFLVSSDISSNIFFWPLKSRKNPIPLSIKKLKSLLFYSFFNNKLIVSGKDDLNRDLILMYDVSKLFKKREVIHLTQQISDFDIKALKFWDESKIISCGKEVIRIWSYKDERFSGINVPVPIKDLSNFTDLEITEKKVYITTAKGFVLVLNPNSKEIETTISIHKSAISRIKVLEDIIITASEDNFLRLWPLDLSELYMEVQHKSKVSCVDLLGNSAISLTESGVLGMIDLQNNQYTVLLRSYKSPQFIDVSPVYYSIISNNVSILGQGLELVCEFASATDDPLVVAIHPFEKIISCGFGSGAVRLFDIESIKLFDEFLHHKAQIEFLTFSHNGRWMVSVAEDGNYSVYDSNQKYHPVKDGKIDVPCNLFVCFSKNSEFFAFITNFGMSIAVFSTDPLTQKFKVNTGNCIGHIGFYDKFLLGLTLDPSKMIYHQIFENKLSVIKEVKIPQVLSKFVVSPNGKFLACIGQDCYIRVYDFFFSLPCQSFLGHSEAITNVIWKGSKIFSISPNDGILVWTFKGDLNTPLITAKNEDSVSEMLEISEESEEPIEIDIEKEVEAYLRHVESIQTNMLIPTKPSLKYMFGYSPIANNLFWSPEKSCLIYTLGSILIKTLLVGQKKQVLFQGHYNQITAFCVSPDHNFVATAEGLANFENSAKINVWNVDSGKIYKVLEYHDKRVTSLSFSACSEYLCSIGNVNESILVVWELVTGRILGTSIVALPPISIKWLPSPSVLEFVSLSGSELIYWRLNSLKHLEFQTGECGQEEMTCMDFSPYFEDISGHLLVIGTSKGQINICNTRTNTLVFSKKIFGFPINIVTCRSSAVIVAGAFAEVYMWYWSDGLFVGNGFKVLCDGIPVSLSFNSTGNEGIIGTSSGSIWFVEWENGTVRVMNSHSKSVSAVAASEYVASASEDFSIRIWNPMTLEQDTHILVPNTVCTCLHFHHTLPYLIAGFADGSLKVFEVTSNKCVGSSQSSLSNINDLCVTDDGDGIVLGCLNGTIIAVSVIKWAPFTVDFFEFASMSHEVLQVDTKNRCVLGSSCDGVLNVWEKKYSGETLMHKNLFEGKQFNLIDIFDFKEPHERTKHIYAQADSLECKARFDEISEKSVWVIIKGAQYLLLRNFSSHSIIKKINLAGFPLCIDVHEHRVAVGLADRRVVVYFDGNIHEYFSHSDPVINLAFFNNGLVTAANNEIALWEF